MNPDAQLAVQEPSVALILQKAIEGGVTAENVAVVEKMMALYERMQDKHAEREYTAALHALQSDMPVIVAKSEIKNRGKYERFEDVMHVVTPLLRKHGFSVTFSNDYDDSNRVKETCKLSHISGHSQSNSFTVRVGKNSDSETQADCKAATTAKRNALLNALNIVIRQDVLQSDDNVGNEGSAITQQEADELRDLVDESGSDRERFLEFAQAKSFEEIASARLPVLHARLQAKMKAAGK